MLYRYLIAGAFLSIAILLQKNKQYGGNDLGHHVDGIRFRYMFSVILLFFSLIIMPGIKISDVSFSSPTDCGRYYLSQNDTILGVLEDKGVCLVVYTKGSEATSGSSMGLYLIMSDDGKWRSAGILGKIQYKTYVNGNHFNPTIDYVYYDRFSKGFISIVEYSKEVPPGDLESRLWPIQNIYDTNLTDFKKLSIKDPSHPEIYWNYYYSGMGVLPDDYLVYINGVACPLSDPFSSDR